MDNFIGSVEEATVLLGHDTNRIYCRKEVEEARRDRAAFISHYRLYRFTKMLVGLQNAFTIFERLMYVIRSFFS